MLLSFRDRVKGSKWIGGVVVVLISIPFALFGIGSYLGGGGNNSAATVNDQEISVRNYEQNYFAQQNQLRAAFGGKIPTGFDSVSFLRRQALEISINQALLLQHIDNSGYAIGDAALRAALYSEPAFQDDGQFSKQRYNRQLQSQGLVAKQFEEQFRQDLSINQMRAGVLSSSFQTEFEHDRASALRNQTRTFSSIVFTGDSVGSLKTPEEKEIEEYYSENTNKFQYPEKVKLEYIELSQAKLAERVVADENDLRQMYENEKGKYVLPEQRRASHILLTTSDEDSEDDKSEKKQLIEKLRDRTIAGESFAELAKKYSQDPGSADQGGDLGAFQRGVMVAEFETAAFDLEVNEISEIVVSSFGYHLIQLTEIIAEQGKSFEQARSEIDQLYRQRESENLYFDLSETLANESYVNDSLDSAAELVDIQLSETDWLEVDSRTDIFSNPVVRETAFSDELLVEKRNSELIELGDNHVVVIRVREHQPGKVKLLDEVHDEIKGILETANRDQKLEAMAIEALDALQKGEIVGQILSRFDADFDEDTTISRSDSSVDAKVLSELFRMSKPLDGPTYSMAKSLDDSYVILILSEVSPGRSSESPSAESTGQEFNTGRGEYTAWVGALRERASVVVNNQLLDDISSQR
jgi:peptidyl-prolyl cis-trans isomerase D